MRHLFRRLFHRCGLFLLAAALPLSITEKSSACGCGPAPTQAVAVQTACVQAVQAVKLVKVQPAPTVKLVKVQPACVCQPATQLRTVQVPAQQTVQVPPKGILVPEPAPAEAQYETRTVMVPKTVMVPEQVKVPLQTQTQTIELAQSSETYALVSAKKERRHPVQDFLEASKARREARRCKGNNLQTVAVLDCPPQGVNPGPTPAPVDPKNPNNLQ